MDWFGRDVRFTNENDDELDVLVSVNEDAMLSRSLQYGEHIEVLEPAALRKKVGAAAKAMSEKYGGA